MTNDNKVEPVNIKLRQKISDYLGEMFMSKKNCRNCWGIGVKVFRHNPQAKARYSPCSCLILKEKVKNESETVTIKEK